MNTNPKTKKEAIEALKEIAVAFDKTRRIPERKKNEGLWAYLFRLMK